MLGYQMSCHALDRNKCVLLDRNENTGATSLVRHPVGPTPCWSDTLLVRHPVGPTHCWSDTLLVRQINLFKDLLCVIQIKKV